MTNKRTNSLLHMVMVSLCICFSSQLAAAQSNKQSEDKETLQALLTEVSLLRQALQTLERMSLDTYRNQLLVDRVRANREDVRRLGASLNETRDQLVRTQHAIPNATDQIKLLENQIQVEVDQARKAQLEFDLKRTRDGVEMYKAQVETLKEREQSLANDLRTEQAKLEDLENRLDLIERGIESDRQKLEADKPAPAKSPE